MLLIHIQSSTLYTHTLNKHLHQIFIPIIFNMHSAVVIALFGFLAIANAGLLGAPAVTVVRAGPVLAAPVAYHHPVVHAPVSVVRTAPVVTYAHAPLVKTVHAAPIVYSGVPVKTVAYAGHPVLLH